MNENNEMLVRIDIQNCNLKFIKPSGASEVPYMILKFESDGNDQFEFLAKMNPNLTEEISKYYSLSCFILFSCVRKKSLKREKKN